MVMYILTYSEPNVLGNQKYSVTKSTKWQNARKEFTSRRVLYNEH